MPYSKNEDLPLAVRKKYSERQQTFFRKVFNAVLATTSDESIAFATAHKRTKELLTKALSESQQEMVENFLSELERDVLEVMQDFDPTKMPVMKGMIPKVISGELDQILSESAKERKDWYIDRVYMGQRFIIKKLNDQVQLFSIDGVRDKDAEKWLLSDEKLVNYIIPLSNDDFIVDAQAFNRNGTFEFILSDILYLGQDLRNKPLYERKKVLSRMEYNTRVRDQVPIAIDKNDISSAIKIYLNLSGGNGCMLKDRNSVYEQKESNSWIWFQPVVDKNDSA